MAAGSLLDMDPDLAPEDALAQLDDVAAQIVSLVERCNKLNSCQEQCAVTQTEFKDPALLHRYFHHCYCYYYCIVLLVKPLIEAPLMLPP